MSEKRAAKPAPRERWAYPKVIQLPCIVVRKQSIKSYPFSLVFTDEYRMLRQISWSNRQRVPPKRDPLFGIAPMTLGSMSDVRQYCGFIEKSYSNV